jgi:RHS repeat-associated protein
MDAAGYAWGSEYDALGRKTENLRPSGASEQFVYDALGNRIGFYNAEGKPITFGFDAQGRVTSITNAIGKVISYQRDVNGNVTNRLDALNRSTTYSFDGMNRMDRMVYPDSSEVSFEYDSNGNVLQVSNFTSQVSFAYDSMNRLSGTVSALSSLSSFAVTNSYDLNGNRTNIIYTGGLSVSYSYDAEDRLTSVTAENAEITKTFSFGYDGASRLTNIVYPNDVSGEFSCDSESRITGFTYNNGSSNFVSRSITRDARGYKTSENITAGLEPVLVEGEQRVTNNDADQTVVINQRDSWLGGELNQWYNREYGYDDNGCLTQEYVSRELWNTNSAINEYRNDYSWDYDSRLAGAEKTVLVPHDEIDGMTGAVMNRTYTDGPSTSTEYIYDASGVRVGRVHNSVTNWFVVDYSDPLKRPLAETDAFGNVTRYYVWAGFRLLAHIESNETVRYYHSDELSSTLALTDENGDVTDQFAYTPYGGVNRTGITQTPFLWLAGCGVYYDSASDLYLTVHRPYSANMRRFIVCDPLGIDGGANLYMYGGLNPLNLIDPLGLNVYAVDGTWFDARITGQYSNVHDLSVRADNAGEFVRYYGGPGSQSTGFKHLWEGATGADSGTIANRVYGNIKSDLAAGNGNGVVNLVGWSRGGVIITEVAQRLDKDNIKVNFLGLYDAVEMNPFRSYPSSVPNNVQNFAHATKTGPTWGLSEPITDIPTQNPLATCLEACPVM